MVESYRSGYTGKLDANEWRAAQYGALEVFQKQTAAGGGILSAEDIANLQKSFGMQTKIPVLDARDVTIGSVRSCVIPPDQNNSKWVVITFVTYVFGFTMIPGMYVNNDVKYQLDFNKKMRAYILALLAKMDAASLNKLEIEKNRVFTGLTVEYPVVGNAFQVPYEKRNDLYNQISGVMQTANFPSGNYDVVANSMHRPIWQKLAANGRTNADNTEFQLLGYTPHFTNNIISNSGVRDTLYVVPENTLFMVNRNTPDERAGTSLMGGGQVWGEEVIPEIGLTFGTYYTEGCTDATQIFPTAETQGQTRASMQSFSFGTDVAYVASYNSNPAIRMGPVNKFEVAVGVV